MEEHRQYIRISKSLEVSYQISDVLLRFGSRSVDISQGGICFPVLQKLEPGTVLELEIRPLGVSNPIMATAEVVWLKERKGGQFPYEAGVKFIEITSSDSKILNSLCKKLEQKHSTDIRRID